MADMVCPKCQGDMRSYERNGVTVEQCSECRGMFLDRGELERLVAAESEWNDRPVQARPESVGFRQETTARRRDRDDDDDDDRDKGRDYPRKRKSFLSELLG